MSDVFGRKRKPSDLIFHKVKAPAQKKKPSRQLETVLYLSTTASRRRGAIIIISTFPKAAPLEKIKKSDAKGVLSNPIPLREDPLRNSSVSYHLISAKVAVKSQQITNHRETADDTEDTEWWRQPV